MVEISDIQSRKSFEGWLKDQSEEIAQVLALRIALRVLPMGLDVWHLSDVELAHERKLDLSFIVFRATFISWLFCKLSDRDILSDASNAADATFKTAATFRATYVDPAYATIYAAVNGSAGIAAYAATNVADSTTDIWQSIQADCRLLTSLPEVEEGGDEIGLHHRILDQPLWSEMNRSPTWFKRHWAGGRDALRTDNVNWEVWIEWFERRIHGGKSEFGLGARQDRQVIEKILDGGDEFWDQGAHGVNAQIAAWIEDARGEAINEARAGLASLSSPQPAINDDGKLDAIPNAEYDKPDVDDDLVDLPIQQRALTNTILASLKPHNSQRNIAPGIVTKAFEEYRDELAARGVQPVLGVLKDQAEIIRAAMGAKYAEDEWCDAPTKTACENFLKNHDKIIEHYPLDKGREEQYAEYEVDESGLSDPQFRQSLKESVEIARAARAEGLTTEEFLRVMEKRYEMLDLLATLPEETEDTKGRVTVRKRRILGDTGFFDKAADLAGKTDKIAKSEAGKALGGGLKKLGEFLWSLVNSGGGG